MGGEPKKISRPILVGHLESQIKRNLAATAAITIGGCAWFWWVYVGPQKRKYVEYHARDIHEEFMKIAKTGAFDSVAPDGGLKKKS